jgi:hypothetical protein
MRSAGGTPWPLTLRNFRVEELVSGLGAGARALLAAAMQSHRHADHAPVAGLVMTAAAGGRGREPSIVGAVACLGLLVTLPAGRWRARRTGRLGAIGRSHHVAVPLVGVHLGVVAVASRSRLEQCDGNIR